ncbi:hypothetical protein FHN55_17035 [Streptomyces sp. NP160]|uniref:hypothetical protein n=1 Tax=Streptomyces sp. NP160 TaxID=2586637 RepID=UPI00111A938E|nr:hypothetical protein [Streptomyces sp. NP160]TNM61533.1 hypothetical protein FHN55_17035 [Streptomyces sp. NP160]
MPNARIKGKALVFKLANTDYSQDLTTLTLESEEADADVTTFADAAAGGATDWYFRGEAVQSTDAATSSLHTYLWANAGATNIAFVYGPHGNATPTVTKPHYTGTVSLGRKPSIGGDADTTWTYEIEIKLDAEPTKVTA